MKISPALSLLPLDKEEEAKLLMLGVAADGIARQFDIEEPYLGATTSAGAYTLVFQWRAPTAMGPRTRHEDFYLRSLDDLDVVAIQRKLWSRLGLPNTGVSEFIRDVVSLRENQA